MEDIYPKALEELESGRPSVLATIIRLTGSGPRGVGTKFLILENGSHVGTIGGGLLEAQVLEGSKGVFATRKPSRISFNLRGIDVAQSDMMICGGQAEVFLEPLLPDRVEQVQLLRKARDAQKRGGSGVMATVVEAAHWKEGETLKLFLKPGEKPIGAFPGYGEIEESLTGEASGLIQAGKAALVVYRDSKGKAVEIFAEPLVSEPTLYVFGGGHVSLQIVPLAAQVGFRTVVIDDRAEFADAKKFPEATEVRQYPFEGVLQHFPVNEASYLVIVTRGHIHDKTVLAQCLKTDAKYIGMIGSRRKIAMIFEKLKEEGFAQGDIERVFAPIGLDIGAETPEEIAVSIVAQLISVRAGGGRRFR